MVITTTALIGIWTAMIDREREREKEAGKGCEVEREEINHRESPASKKNASKNVLFFLLCLSLQVPGWRREQLVRHPLLIERER